VVAGQGVRIGRGRGPWWPFHIGATDALASQPAPFSKQGKTVSGKVTTLDAQEPTNPAVPCQPLARSRSWSRHSNLLGVSARDLVAVLQAMKAAGAIDADLEVM